MKWRRDAPAAYVIVDEAQDFQLIKYESLSLNQLSQLRSLEIQNSNYLIREHL